MKPPTSARLPGAWLLAIAARLFEESVRTAVVHQTIADLQAEWLAAESRLARAKARALGYVAFWSLVAIAPFAFGSKQRRALLDFFWRFDMSLGTNGRLVVILFVLGLASGWLYATVRPAMYQSTAVLQLVPSRISSSVAGDLGVTSTASTEDYVRAVSQIVLSRTRLERLIQEFDLYRAERKVQLMEDVVQRFRSRIHIAPDDSARQALNAAIVVSFVDSNPTAAMKVTERLAGYLKDEQMKDAEMRAQGTASFLESAAEELKRKLEVLTVDAERAGRSTASHPRRLEIEVLENLYKDVLKRRAQAEMSVNLESRQMGEQLILTDAARLPERAMGLTRVQYTLAGGAAGLVLAALIGITLSIRRMLRRNQRLAEAPTA